MTTTHALDCQHFLCQHHPNGRTRVVRVTLPQRHAADWLERYEGDDAREESRTTRTISLYLGVVALRDLIKDARYYAHAMGPRDTGDGMDYRPAARRCLAKLDNIGRLDA